ncbi:carboxypeptidase regulatory-like domain-containing protein [Nocardioides sp.]|uniref:carboxypeptidase regulatory-like domain-containing protein n=1 Tax=Nocardioides sp. TaxID=35761 RepID=UPI003511D87F
MRLDISPRELQALPGVPQQIALTITNTGTVIGGYRLRLLGLDPAWVQLDSEQVSLFPEESGTITATVTVPVGLPAGERRLSVQVRELTPPHASELADITLTVPEARDVRLAVDPPTTTAGRRASYSVLVSNTGNTRVAGRVMGDDPEATLRFTSEPAEVDLGPGEHAVVNLKVSGRRPFAGSPRLRLLEVHLVDPTGTGPATGPSAPAALGAAEAADPADPPAADLAPPRVGRRRSRPAPPEGSLPLAQASLVQKSFLARGALSLLGLLAAVTVFAIVITIALSRIVDQSAADRELALKIAAARDGAGQGTGRSGIEGTVVELATGQPAPGVVVTVYRADDPSTPLVNDATGSDGGYRFRELPAGSYKLTFRGAGFVPTWYPQALDPDNAEEVELDDGTVLSGLDVAIGGVPASITGTVVGDDVSEATVTLRTPSATALAPAGPTAGRTVARAAPGSTSAAPTTPTPTGDGAVVQAVAVGAEGRFTIGDVPSPAVYDLVVTKPGYAPAVQRIDVSAGEERRNVEINLTEGNGIIAGTVVAGGAPLGNATVTVSSGQTTSSTLSLTDGDVGTFTLRRLPTPATYTLVASAEGYASQTLTVTLADRQELTGVTLTLGTASGTLAGTALTTDGDPAPGVSVTVTDGTRTVQTATRSSGTDLGTWEVTGLPIPGSYTVTLARSDLSSQTISVSLDASGLISGDVTGTGRLSTVLSSSTAVVQGTISQRIAASTSTPGAPETVEEAGEVTVTLTSGSRTYSVTTATRPDDRRGEYVIEGIVPGTYTISVGRSGVSPRTAIRTLVAGQRLDYSLVLAPPARVSGTVVVVDAAGTEQPANNYRVELYRAADYPGVVYATVTTDSQGRYEFPDVDAPENFVIQVRRSTGSVPLLTTNIALDPSEQRVVNLRIES